MNPRIGCLLVVAGFTCVLASGVARAQKTINVPTDQPTIQAGVNSANAGDTVLVAPGTYPENVTISAEITLAAAACVNPVAGCNSQTTIDAQGLGSAVSISNTPSLKTTVTGFSLINGRSGTSGSTAGVLLTNAGATISNNSFSANAAAISVNYGSVSFTGNQISTVIGQSPCSSGNGIRLSGDSVVVDSTGAQVQDSIFGNVITAAGKCAGGVGIIAQQGGNLSIAFNQISGQALAINTFATNGTIFMNSNLITGNTAGGIYIQHAVDTPGVDPADVLLVNNTIANNLSGAKGLNGAAGPAEVYVSGTYSKVELLNNVLSTNSATNPVLDCAGAISSAANPVTPIILDHNLFWNPAGKLGLDGCPVTVGTYGNINANPGFVSATSYQLSSGSPAIDAGNNSGAADVPGATDIAGNPRVQQVTSTTGPVIDMGAYEFSGSTKGSATLLTTSSSSYYVTSGNMITLSAQLLGELSVTNGATTPAPNQVLDFYQNGMLAGTAVTGASGVGTISLTLPSAGVYAFTTNYNGVTASSSSVPSNPAVSPVIYVYVTSPLAVTTVTLGSSLNPSTVGQAVTFTVTSNSTDGTYPSPVVLADNGVTLTTLTIPSSGSSAGSATYTTSTLAAGSHPLTATFAGDATHTAGSASLTQVVGNAAASATMMSLSSSANPAAALSSIVFTARLTTTSAAVGAGNPIVFSVAGGPTATVPTDATGTATFTVNTLTPGTYVVTASFAGTSALLGSSQTLSEVVTAIGTTTTLIAAPNPGVQGGAVTLVATVAAATGTAYPVGNVAFLDGGATLGTVPVTGAGGVLASATLRVSTLAPGTHLLTAVYTPTGTSFSGSTSAVLSLVIAPQDFSLTAQPPAITIETQHHGSVAMEVASIGGFAGPITVRCGALPAEVTCELPGTLQLGANSNVSFTLTLDTDAVLGFMDGIRPGLVMLLPLSLAGLLRRRKGIRMLLMLLALALPGVVGCGAGKYPAHTPPGTYVIPVIATGTAQGSTVSTSHTVNITLTVTP